MIKILIICWYTWALSFFPGIEFYCLIVFCLNFLYICALKKGSQHASFIHFTSTYMDTLIGKRGTDGPMTATRVLPCINLLQSVYPARQPNPNGTVRNNLRLMDNIFLSLSQTINRFP